MEAIIDAYGDAKLDCAEQSGNASDSIALRSSIVCYGMQSGERGTVYVGNNDQDDVEDESSEEEYPLRSRIPSLPSQGAEVAHRVADLSQGAEVSRLSQGAEVSRLSQGAEVALLAQKAEVAHPPPESPSFLSSWKREHGCMTPGCIYCYNHHGDCHVESCGGRTRQEARDNVPNAAEIKPKLSGIKRKLDAAGPKPVSFKLMTSPVLSRRQRAKTVFINTPTDPKGVSSSHGVRTASASSSLAPSPLSPSPTTAHFSGAKEANAIWRIRSNNETTVAVDAVPAASNSICMSSKHDGVIAAVGSAPAPTKRVTWFEGFVEKEIEYVVADRKSEDRIEYVVADRKSEDRGRFYGFVASLLAALEFFANLEDAKATIGCGEFVTEARLCEHFNMVKIDLTKTHLVPLFSNGGTYLISGHIRVDGEQVRRTVAVKEGELLFYDCKRTLRTYDVANEILTLHRCDFANEILLPSYANKLAKGNGCLDTISRVYAVSCREGNTMFGGGGCTAIALTKLGVFETKQLAMDSLNANIDVVKDKMRTDDDPNYYGVPDDCWHYKVVSQTLIGAGYDIRKLELDLSKLSKVNLRSKLNNGSYLVSGILNDHYVRKDKGQEVDCYGDTGDMTTPASNEAGWRHSIAVRDGQILEKEFNMSTNWLWLDENNCPDRAKGYMYKVLKVYEILPSHVPVSTGKKEDTIHVDHLEVKMRASSVPTSLASAASSNILSLASSNSSVEPMIDPSDLNELWKFLDTCRLQEYYPSLSNNGWDDLNYMKEKSEKFLRANLTDKPVNMKPGHFLKFMDKLAEFK